MSLLVVHAPFDSGLLEENAMFNGEEREVDHGSRWGAMELTTPHSLYLRALTHNDPFRLRVNLTTVKIALEPRKWERRLVYQRHLGDTCIFVPMESIHRQAFH